MQTLLTAAQMREADAHTIQQQKISSIKLMERAAIAFVKAFEKEVKYKSTSITIVCGRGNNGGDGLAISRLLGKEKYQKIKVYVVDFSGKQSGDFKKNLDRLSKTKIPIHTISDPDELKLERDTLLIDAILGSGLNKALTGKYAILTNLINTQTKQIVAVDVPTGMNSEGPIDENYNGIKAGLVISFQLPKINFFFPESIRAMDRYRVVNIDLDGAFIAAQPQNWQLTIKNAIQTLIQKRKNFTHKGTYGHALLVAGDTTTLGAAILSACGCVYAGAGLTTVCLPQSGLAALNTILPEAMALPRNSNLAIEAFEKFTSIAIGPGLGIGEEQEELFSKLIGFGKPLIVDADGLTMLSNRKDLLDELAAGSILTPHLKEFDRLFGKHQNWWERVETAKKEAMKRKWVIVLKNQYTFVCQPSGEIVVNPTGNPAMASGGMGDVLTGIITSFVAQAYSSADAAILGVYVHGKAGDQLAKKGFTVTASQVAKQIPRTLFKLVNGK